MYAEVVVGIARHGVVDLRFATGANQVLVTITLVFVSCALLGSAHDGVMDLTHDNFKKFSGHSIVIG